MNWCRLTTSHNVSQCWPRSMSPYDVTRPQWLDTLWPSDTYMRRWSNQQWFRQWLVAWSAPSHYLNQCWNIVNWTIRHKIQWNFNQNESIFIQENAFEKIVCEIAAILSQRQCVGLLWFYADLLSYPYPIGLLQWHWGMISQIPVKQPHDIAQTKQPTTNPCAYLRDILWV